MHFIEEEIRRIIAKAIIKLGDANEVKHTDVQIKFLPFVKDDKIICRYQLLLDYKPKEELSFIKIAGAMNGLAKPVIENYISNLYVTIAQNEDIEIGNIRILILAVKENPEITDIKAFLYENGNEKRELLVSEFIEKQEEEKELIEENENE